MFLNPLSQLNFSDPFITYDKKTGYYYFIASCQCNQLTLYRSKKVSKILTEGESKVVFECGFDEVYGPMWAPEMYKVGNKWYIYTSCREKWDDNMFAERKIPLILQSKTEDPFDGFEFGSKPDPSIFAIDPTSMVIDGKQYICYSRVNEKGVQVLDIREMSDPLTFTEKVAQIAAPSLEWELAEGYQGDSAINEGAFFIQKRVFLPFHTHSFESALPEDLINGYRDRVRKIVTSERREHRNTHASVRIFRNEMLGKSDRFLAENKENVLSAVVFIVHIRVCDFPLCGAKIKVTVRVFFHYFIYAVIFV